MPFFKTLEAMRSAREGPPREQPPLTTATSDTTQTGRCVWSINETVPQLPIHYAHPTMSLGYPTMPAMPVMTAMPAMPAMAPFKAGCSPMACEYAPWYCPMHRALPDWCRLCLNRRLFPERCAPDPR